MVGTIGGDGVEGVGDGDDAGHHRNLIAGEAVGVACAVHALVVQLDAGEHVFQLRDGAHDVGALGGMLLHQVEFFVGELAGLFQDAIVHADFADVMQQRGDAQAVELFGVQSPCTRR